MRAPQTIAQAIGGGGSAIDVVVVSRYGPARGFSIWLLAGRGLRKLSQASRLLAGASKSSAATSTT
jgi:hypothetical protein